MDHRTIRAWKDADFRASLDPNEDGAPAPSPVGGIELDDADLGDVAGGAIAITVGGFCQTSLGCFTAAATIISNQISCGACNSSMWHGTCGFSSIGCCS